MLKYAEDDLDLDGLFHALSDPTRRAIVVRLTLGPATVSELASPLPMSLPAVHQHLTVLEKCGLVRSHKVGRARTCRLQGEKLSQAESWMTQRRAAWEQRLDRLGAYLDSLQATDEVPGVEPADEPGPPGPS
jgi:DNA-binding transcriptional ArsR family regulator